MSFCPTWRMRYDCFERAKVSALASTKVVTSSRRPVFAGESVDSAVVGPYVLVRDELESVAFVEAPGTRIRRHGIHEDGFNGRIGQAAFDCHSHGLRTQSTPYMGFFSDLDVDGAQVFRAVAPVMAVLARGR